MRSKNLLRILVSGLLLVLWFNVFALDKYTFDPDHTYAVWSVSHFGYSDVSGKLMANGTLNYDLAKPQNSQVEISFLIDSVTTGIPKLDKKLMGKNFFDLKKFPTASFISNRIQMTGKETAKVYGLLTIRGMKKPVVLNVRLTKSGDHPLYRKKTLGFSGSAVFDRSAFGLRAYLPGVGDKVTLNIQAEAVLNYQPKKK